MAQQGEEALGPEVQESCQWVRGEETDERDCPKDYSRHICDLQSSYPTSSEAAFAPAAACAALSASIQRTLYRPFKLLKITYTKANSQITGIRPEKEECWLNTVTTSHVSRFSKAAHYLNSQCTCYEVL